MSDRIFISHATEDAELALNIVDYIENNTDMKCWIAPRNIPSGQSWITSINEAVKNCTAIVLVLSADAAKSDWVLREISTGITLKKNIFPFKLTDKAADSDLYFSVSTLQWIDGTTNPKSKFPELVEALRGDENKVHTVEPTLQQKPPRKRVTIAVASAVILLAVLAAVAQPWKHGGDTALELSADSVSSIDAKTSDIEPAAVEVQPNSHNNQTTKRADKASSSKTDLKKERQSVEEASNAAAIENGQVADPVVEGKAADVQPVEPTEVKPQENTADAQEIAFKKKYDKATKLYAAKKYEQALMLFKELKQEKPHEGSLDTYIASCRQKLARD